MSASSKSSTQSVFESRNHHDQAFEVFYDMRANSELCDITLKIGNLKFTAHKVVLAASSSFFRQKFSSQDEVGSYEMSLPDFLKPDAMAAMLDYLYTGYLRINTENMEDLLAVACFIKNEQVLHAILEKVLANVSISNCLRLQQIASTNNLTDMQDKVERFIEWNFEHVAKEPSFLSLDAKVVKDIIKRDNLKVTNEEVVYDAVYSWFMYERLQRLVFMIIFFA
ncbi:kelch-like protein 18 [Exaiptasia diaphana]|uniref:BTB domain-containing protein n=1 Tax=Exaiptasia diaphana TaxID=2652724 RepID=A0A913YEF5_EXADI|nr:kelch-like protein 18 [Exaiptasia diaphana]